MTNNGQSIFIKSKINIFNPKSNKMSVGFKIKKLREKKSWSQQDLADKLEIGQTKISNIENEITEKIDFQLMDKICKIFDVDFQFFIDDNNTNNINNLNGGVAGNNYGNIYNNNYPENIIDQIKILLNDLKEKEKIIAMLENQLNNRKQS